MNGTLRTLLLFFLATHLSSDEWNGNEFLRHSSVQKSHAEYLLDHLSFQGDEKILDIGCGDGRVTAFLAKQAPRGLVIGLDPSRSMLEKARENNLPKNLQFVQARGERFLIPEKFDHVFAIHVMHWIKEQDQALRNIYHHLKPGGKVHFIIATPKDELPLGHALKKTVIKWADAFADFVNPQQFFEVESYKKTMAQAGLHADSIRLIFHESVHQNREKLGAWIKQWLPHGKHLPESQRDEFYKDLMDNYLAEINRPFDSMDPVPYGEYVLFVEGSKRCEPWFG